MQLISQHAKARMQQRGVKQESIDYIIEFGKEYYRTRVYTYLATKEAIKSMIKCGVPKKIAIKCRGIYVIIENGQIQTVAHKQKHFRHD